MSRQLAALPFALLAVSSLGACATLSGGGEQATAEAATGAPQGARPIDRRAREQVAREDTLTQMAFWAGEYQTFPNDLEAAQRFAEALRKGGRTDRAAQIAGEALSRFPDDRQLMTTYGYAQLTLERPQQALRPLAVVAAAEPENWRVRSALGAALDQLGRFQEARQAYQEALALQPNNAGILTNLGVSHIMAGEPDDAEPILRQAVALPGAPAEARQNLAIAVALQGRFDEAEQIERVDLPPAQAAQNIQYLRGLLSDPRRWNDMGRGR
ncbi:MAG: tetratricopeptide repeat protein [Hyphomonadaceae bacterium]|jgi:Flp pilus assembly protein TadD|nr:tetratricopeptide repeat protein [Hyphomonadaceae bacterium]